MKMSNWRDDEIRELLSVRADVEIVRQIQGTAKDSVVYDQITRRLHERGVFRAKAQVNNKLKALKRQYHQVVEHNGGGSEDGNKTWCYFSLCEAIWGPNRSTKPVALVGSVETDSTTTSPETPHSDTGEKPTVYETDVSINESAISTESPCHSPPKKKKRGRNQTRSERLSEMNIDEKTDLVTRPSPSTSPCTSAQKKRRTIEDDDDDAAVLKRLAHLEEERQKLMQRDNADFRFAAVIVDMLANVNPKHKSELKFQIYQMLFEAGRDFPKES